VALLIHLNGINTFILSFVVESFESGAEAVGEHPHAAFHDVGKPNPKRSAKATIHEIIHELVKIERGPGGAFRGNFDPPGFVNGEKVGAPAWNIV